MKSFTGVVVLLAAFVTFQVIAAPSGDVAASGSFSASKSVSASHSDTASGSASGSFQIPFLTFDKGGNVGVNFGGYRASAGLGGLLTGDRAQGGLHASAETPYGQRAAAGLGGRVGGAGGTAGGLYAGATAGGDVSAAAGLDGVVSNSGVVSGSKSASASAGGAFTSTKTVSTVVQEPQPQVYATKQVYVQPVPVPAPAPEVVYTKPAEEDVVYYKTKTKIRTRPRHMHHHHIHKYFTYDTNVQPALYSSGSYATSFNGGINAAAVAPQITAQKTVHIEKQKVVQPLPVRPVVVHKIRPALYGNGGANVGYSTTVTKNINGGALIRDIFNIPIATLEAVSQLVGNVAGSHSVSVSKSVSSSHAG